jgi:hypothetical protein
MEPNETMTDSAQAERDTPPPMLKEETVKDDGRTLIYYTFSDAPALNAAEEDTHV